MTRRTLVSAIAGLVVVAVVGYLLADRRVDDDRPADAWWPDRAGVVTAVGPEMLQLDGQVSLSLTEASVVSSYTGAALDLRPWMYVHVGLDGDAARWVRVLGVVTRGDPPVVTYTARVRVPASSYVIFSDGTVLPHAGLTVWPGYAIATIDPSTGEVVRFHQDLVQPSDAGP